jgi:hypothetical protein
VPTDVDALVVTVTVAVAPLAVGTTLAGLTVQVDPEGCPEHVRDTELSKPLPEVAVTV